MRGGASSRPPSTGDLCPHGWYFAAHCVDCTQATRADTGPFLDREDLVERLVAASATAFAVAVANAKWAREEHRRAEALVATAKVVAERMACDHMPRLGVEVDPECGRCEWMQSFREALAVASRDGGA